MFNKAKLNPGRSNGLGFVKEPINTFVLIFPKCQSDIIFKEFFFKKEKFNLRRSNNLTFAKLIS